MSDESDFSYDDLDTIVQMQTGDFSRVVQMLLRKGPIHYEVRAALAEYLSSGNAYGRLIFRRPKGRASREAGDVLVSALRDFRDVTERLEQETGKARAIRFVAEHKEPRRSYEAVRQSYYEGCKITKQLAEDPE